MTTLQIFQDETHNPTLADFRAAFIAVLGVTGSGKSNTAGRLTEQLLHAGLPMLVVDIAGEYWGLKERYPLIVVGKSAHVDIELNDPSQAATLARWSLEERVSIIFDFSGWRSTEKRMEMLLSYLEALWDIASEKRRPYSILLEEAHNWIPQSGKTAVSEILTFIATEGRKRGLGIIMVGQRSARINKDVLSQCGIYIFHRARHPADISVYQDLLAIDKKQVKGIAIGLPTGSALYSIHDTVTTVRVLQRETFHDGYTPGMEETHVPTLTNVSPETLHALKALLATKPESEIESPSPNPNREAELETTIAEQVAQIRELEAELERLRSYLTIQQTHPIAEPTTNGSSNTPQQLALLELPERTPIATTRAIKKQEREFATLLHDIRTAIPMHRAILLYLLERPHREFTRRELARYVGYQEATIVSAPPLQLIREGLLQRSARQKQHFYSAMETAQKMATLFPDLDADDLYTRLLLAAGAKR